VLAHIPFKDEPAYAAIAEMAQSGAALSEVAEAFGISKTGVHGALRRMGVEVNFRVTRAQREKHQLLERLAAGQKASVERERQTRLARWAELGKTWEATNAMGEEYGISGKAMRAYLQKAGEIVPLPNGRQR
jgi:hypothetical protein